MVIYTNKSTVMALRLRLVGVGNWLVSDTLYQALLQAWTRNPLMTYAVLVLVITGLFILFGLGAIVVLGLGNTIHINLS